MGLLDEAGLQRLTQGGCACGSVRRVFGSFVDGMQPLQGGEPVGAVKWIYDGERFTDGVFEVGCADCNASLFNESLCPRCHAEGGLARALERTNAWPVPAACPDCENEELRYLAMIPVRVTYEGGRAAKPRCSTELYDPGFHGYRAECRDCGPIATRKGCPLCGTPDPIRARPS